MKSLKDMVVAFATASVVFFGAFAEPVEISTAEQFAAQLAANPAGDYKLTANITLTSWESLEEFSGTLDGNSKSIRGLEIPLFQNLSGTVKNLTIDGNQAGDNTEISIPIRADFALLALTTTAARVESVNVHGYSLFNNQPADKTLPKNRISFLVAYAYDGTVFSKVVTTDRCRVSLGGDLDFGGVAGAAMRTSSYSGTDIITFTGCVNNASIATVAGCSGTGNGSIGGILGRDAVGSKSGASYVLSFIDCVNNGGISPTLGSGNTTFGGILGIYSSGAGSTASNTARFIACANHGSYVNSAKGYLCNNLSLGGIIGFSSQYSNNIYIDGCINDGDFLVGPSSSNGCRLGGFIGSLMTIAKNANVTVRNSVHRGQLYAPGNVSAGKNNSAGGVVASATGYTKGGFTGIQVHVENCSFSGELTAYNEYLVAAGFCTSATMQSDLVFAIDNCWFSQTGDLVDTATIIANYSATNIKIHNAGEEAAECQALAQVAEGEDDYLTWQINGKSGCPEPVLGAMRYTVGFDDYDDSLIAMRLVSAGSAAVAPPNPTRAGYSFVGWVPSDFASVISNMTIVATYEQSADYRSVTFLDWDETVLDQITIPSGTAVGSQAPTPSRTGYTFKGWTLDGVDYDLSTPVTEDITLDAKYQINQYNVVFFDWEDNQLGETQKINYLEAAVAPALPPIPEGKVFWKWSDDFSSVTEDMEIYARICDRVQHISTAAEFKELINAQSPSVVMFYLDADIVLSDWTSVNFFASLNGQGHIIGGLTKPLFNTLKGSTVENLVFTNCVLTTTDESVFGLVACSAGDATVIRRVATASDCLINAGVVNMAAGGIVGQLQNGIEYEGDNCSWIIDCTNRAAIVKTTNDSNSRGAIGGIVGSIESRGVKTQPAVTNGISGCVNYGNITCNFNGGHIAGLVGRVCTFNEYALTALIGSANFADVVGVTSYGSDQYKSLIAAGLIARVATSQDATCDILVDGCVNRGRVSVGFEPDGQTGFLNKTASGMIALIDVLSKNRALTIRNSANYGDVEGENAAGVIARFNAGGNYANTRGVIENCASYGAVSGRTAAALAVAKWTHPNDGVAFTRTVTNCFFIADADRALPIASLPEGFQTAGNVIDSDPGYTPDTACAQLNAEAMKSGWTRWCVSPLAGVDVPQLRSFAPFKSQGLYIMFK